MPPGGGTASGTVMSRPTQVGRRKVALVGGALIVGVALVALLLVRLIPAGPVAHVNSVLSVIVEPAQAACSAPRTLVGTIDVKALSTVKYHWEFPTGAREQEGADRGRQAAGDVDHTCGARSTR